MNTNQTTAIILSCISDYDYYLLVYLFFSPIFSIDDSTSQLHLPTQPTAELNEWGIQPDFIIFTGEAAASQTFLPYTSLWIF